jgi:hypothetical protein
MLMVQLDIANNVAALVGSLIGIVLTLVGLVAWFIRLESKVMYLEKDLETEKKHNTDRNEVMWSKMDAVQGSLHTVLQGIGKIEGRLESIKNDK